MRQEQIQRPKKRRAHIEENIEPPLPRDEREQIGETTIRIVQKIDEVME